jgi:PleD family two-component response regulator
MTNSKPTVLIVDDERNLRQLLTHAINIEGYAVETASNGKACLSFCQQHLPDLILMDALMPEMDGFACCETLQATFGDRCPPVLMITALADTASVERAFAVGAVDYGTKPIHWAVLRQRVRRILQTRLMEQQLEQAHQQIEKLQEALRQCRTSADSLAASRP